MLSVKNLVKVYKTKGGAEVRALDDVTVDFPEKGMVFLLGKSGSGKSTLLNVAGGLDVPDSGEIIVKGRSSKSFSGADFDSYRNTYVGFVFQEYNILDEFNIEQNIALALQLQGKKNDKAEVNRLLEMVDLKGFGKRKPNTLSGGQKQRVAIARALIKEPEIIMADEPTGALDSVTGKHVFETLKKLSENKLVIVVSHDREFAEQYGDRIIELKDGKIISDTSKTLASPVSLSENVNAIGNDTVRVKDWSKLTQDEFKSIYNMMKTRGGEVIISSNAEDMTAIKRACKITDDGRKEYFAETKPEDTAPKRYDESKTQFIKSRLPAGYAFKMGASGLKTKPIRLFFTIILSVISFAMFGILSTMMLYDPVYSIADALRNSSYTSMQLNKYYTYTSKQWRMDVYGEREYIYENDTALSSQTLFGESEIKDLNNNSYELNFAGVCTSGSANSFSSNLSEKVSDYYSYGDRFYGFTDCGEEYLNDIGYSCMAGRYPDSADEVAVSEYVYNMFNEGGYYDDSGTVSISTPADLVGKTLDLYFGRGTISLTISGVYATSEPGGFEALKEDNNYSGDSEYNELQESMLDVVQTGFYSLAFVAPEFIDAYSDSFISYSSYSDYYAYSMSIYGTRFEHSYFESYNDQVDQWYSELYYPEAFINKSMDYFMFFPVDDSQTMTSLSLNEDEVYVSLSARWVWNAVNDLANALLSGKGYYVDQPENAEFKTAYERYEDIYLGTALDSGTIELTAEDVNLLLNCIKEDWVECGLDVAWDHENETPDMLTLNAANSNRQTTSLNIKGFFINLESFRNDVTHILNPSFVNNFGVIPSGMEDDDINYIYGSDMETEYVVPSDARYNYAITPAQNTMDQVSFVLEDRGAYYYGMTNNLYLQASYLANTLDMFKFVFLITGAVMAVLSALMLFNFISASIAAKNKEIGVLRAVGTRGIDVFKIFFAEALIIALICFIIATIGAGVACYFMNGIFSSSILSFSVLNFGLPQVGLIFGISTAISFIATILPVFFAARKSPVESIRAL